MHVIPEGIAGPVRARSESRTQGCETAGWHLALIKHLFPHSHAPRGNAVGDALRPVFYAGSQSGDWEPGRRSSSFANAQAF